MSIMMMKDVVSLKIFGKMYSVFITSTGYMFKGVWINSKRIIPFNRFFKKD